MNKSSNGTEFDELIEQRINGLSVEPPTEWQVEFDQAISAHNVLQNLLVETVTQADSVAEHRSAPSLDDEFEVVRELGAGGMGVVYLVRQKSLGRHVALKVLRSALRESRSQLERFLGEARHLARLKHPHIVSIHEVGMASEEPFFTMDYIEGESLAKRIAKGALSPSQAIAIWKQTAAAIQFAHRQGIIHRDLKPSNVLLDQDGQAYVTDFGLARDMSGSEKLTQSGELLGTPQYMAPEQIRGQSQAVGEGTDVYGLGLLLYEMLSGRPAFTASTMADMMVKSLQDSAPPLRELDRRIPLDLETICFRALEKEPERRYANVAAMLEDVRRWEAGEPLLAKRPSLLKKTWRWMRSHWKIGATALATACLVLALTWPYFDQSYDNLMAMGDEEFASGEFEVAARVYARAATKAGPNQIDQAIQQFARSSRNMKDGQAVVELALPLLAYDADFSLGPHDYLLAMAVAQRYQSSHSPGSLNDWHTVPNDGLQLVRTRLERALSNNLSDDEKLRTEEVLSCVDLAMSVNRPWSRSFPQYLHELPSGTKAEIQALMDDENEPHWNRAKAGIALGRELEKQGEPQAVIQVYEQALVQVKKVYPMLSGVIAARGTKVSRLGAPDTEETGLVRDLVSSLQRLDSNRAIPTGFIEFSVSGFPLGDKIGIELVLELMDPAVENPNLGLPHDLPRLVPVRQDAPISVHVLAGTYRIRLSSHHARWDDSVSDVAERLEVDVQDWPETITIGTGTVTLPPIQLRLCQEMEFLEPVGDFVKLPGTVFQWREIPGAVRYQVVFQAITESPHQVIDYFMPIKATTNKLELAALNEQQKQQLRTHWTLGATGGWSVDAYDAKGRRIGKTLTTPRFVITESIED